MRVQYSSGYSTAAPSEIATTWQGRLRPSSSKRPIMCSMGYGSGPDGALITPQVGLGRIADAGLVAIHGDFGGTNTWGNDTAQSRMDEGWAWIKANMPCATDKVILVGQSMGGLDVLNWAHAHLSSVAAIALCHPAIDLEDIHDNNRAFAPHPGGFAVDIEAAYTNLAGYNAAKATHNPNRYPSDFAGIPMFIQYSTNDPICIPSIGTAFGAAAGATMYNAGDVSHGFGAMPSDQIYNFIGQYA